MDGDRADFIGTGFSGGMNLFTDATRLADNEYIYGQNVRVRTGVAQPTKIHRNVDAPAGKKQGIETFGQFVLLFVAGKAYYRDVTETIWHEVVGYSMSAVEDFLYTCAIPQGTMNFQRKLTDAADTQAGTKYNSAIVYNGSNSGIVCQDGVSRPHLIYISGGVPVARELDDYGDWQNTGSPADAREYVPIGTMMLYHDSVLYLIDPTRTKILRSVTGRPLDFVINVDINGDKGGDAGTTYWPVNGGEITCIAELNTDSFFISTLNNACYAFTPIKTDTIFGEPKFKRTYLFNATCLNQYCFVDILGDFAFIDPEGLRSFNAVLQQNNEGRNSVFSQKIANALGTLRQDPGKSAAIVWNNYAIFAMQTIFGRCFVVYDTLYEVFVSFDINQYGQIHKFAAVAENVLKLYAITDDDEVIECYGGTDYAQGLVKTKEWTTNDPNHELKTESLRAVFICDTTAGSVTTTIYVDGAGRPAKHLSSLVRPIPDALSGLRYVVTYPALWRNTRKVVNISFPFGGGVGFKVGFLLRWTGGSSLSHLKSLNSSVDVKNANSGQIAR